MTLPILTASRIKTFRRCVRLHHLRYVLGYRAVVVAAALRFGTLVHLALQRWWEAQLPEAERTRLATALRSQFEREGRRAMPGEERLIGALERADPLEAALAAIEVETAAGDEGEAAFDRVKAEILIAGYHHRWINAGLVPLAVEVEFRTALINPATGRPSRVFALGGKIDVLAAEGRTGRVLVIEHKTASENFEDGSVYRARLKLNNQISVYFRGAETLGYAPAASLYDVVGKPSLRPLRATPLEQRKYTQEKRDKDGNVVEPARLYSKQRETDETPAEYAARLQDDLADNAADYFARFDVVRLEDEMAEHAADLWQTARAIREAERAGHSPKNDDACFAYGRPCEFLPVCVREASLDDASRYVRSDDVHPELTSA